MKTKILADFQICISATLNELHEMYVFVSIDKAAYNIAIICKKYNATDVLKEIGILDAENETCEKINNNQEGIIQDNSGYNTRPKLSNGSKDKTGPSNYIKIQWVLGS